MIGSDAVLSALQESVARGQLGLQVAAYKDGELVVDAWAGPRQSGGPPVDGDTVFWAASCGKASTATAAQVMAERGLLDVTSTIASIWPEFAAHGKGKATVADALAHRVGLPFLPDGATYAKQGDWDWMTERLAASEPAYEPGTKNAYHSRTWGYIVGEIIRRTDPQGRPFPQIVREEVDEPLGIADLWHQFPAAEAGRVALVSGPCPTPRDPGLVIGEDNERNTVEYWERINPSGAMMTARAGARMFAMYAHGGELDGGRLLSARRVRSLLTPRPDALSPDVTAKRVRYMGIGGLWLGGPHEAAEPIMRFGQDVLWHPGGGGTVGFADLHSDLAVMICHNRLYNWEGLSMAEHPMEPIVAAIYKEFGR
jgi:CubicO group peptidase (beta-lactamase class C family)